MKEVRGRALKVVQDLVRTTMSKKAICKRHGVDESTLYKRWLKDPIFLEHYREELDRFEAELRTVRFASKLRRVRERMRLYRAIPDTGEERWMDGSIRRVHVNAPAKNAILDAIERELEGTRIAVGEVGSKLDIDLREQRRKAAADLDEFEKAG